MDDVVKVRRLLAGGKPGGGVGDPEVEISQSVLLLISYTPYLTRSSWALTSFRASRGRNSMVAPLLWVKVTLLLMNSMSGRWGSSNWLAMVSLSWLVRMVDLVVDMFQSPNW